MVDDSKPFDPKALLGFALLIALVLLLPVYWEWIGFSKPVPSPGLPTTDTTTVAVVPDSSRPAPKAASEAVGIAAAPADTGGGAFLRDSSWTAQTVHIQTGVYDALLSNRGARLVRLALKKYHYNDEARRGQPIIVLDSTDRIGPRFWFPPDQFDWSDAMFTGDRPASITLSGNDSATIRFNARTRQGNDIAVTYTFRGNRYDFDVRVAIPAPWDDGIENEYYFGWEGGLKPTEPDPKDDNGYFAATALMGKDLEKISKYDAESPRKNLSGLTRWASVQTKYFVSAAIPRSRAADGFLAVSSQKPSSFKGQAFSLKEFSSALRMTLPPGAALNDRFTVYVGPIEYGLLKSYGVDLEDLVDLGWRWLIRPFAFLILWLMTTLHALIPNYGVAIIVFALLIKALFHPLTKKSTRSMRQMQELQPHMDKLRERHKDDPQRLNKEIMKLYHEAGINPLSGCLTLLPQMPIFFALYQVLRTTIDMRGAYFVGWLTDLSQKDPYYILPIIMTISFFLQQRLSTRDPKQKMLTYVLPLVFGFFFKDVPAGLTLYWTVFNIFSVIEQVWLIGHPAPSGGDGEVGAGTILQTAPVRTKTKG